MSDIALTKIPACWPLVAVVGLWIGNIKIRGVGFGIGGVLFGGIFVGHFADKLGWFFSAPICFNFYAEFGLILFVYTIGIQVRAGLFRLIAGFRITPQSVCLGIVNVGGLVTAILHKLFAIPLPVVLEAFLRAVTNTPALGAGQQILRDFGYRTRHCRQMGMSLRAMAYPFGITAAFCSCGWFGCSFALTSTKAKDHETTLQRPYADQTINIRVDNPT
ncbi:hypothetical protein KIF59_10605 [Enterobacter cloacae subsp. cloacae]|nr:hypothetical protein [Enterobacter cloacae subsp. cloacae]